MRRNFILVGTAVILSLGTATVAFAQEQTVPNTSVRNLEPPADVRGKQIRAEHPAMSQEGRSAAEMQAAPAPTSGEKAVIAHEK